MAAIKRKVQYIYVADKIRTWVKSQKLKPDTPVMSCRDIAQKYDVSIKTARNAVTQLVDEGVLYLVQGSGTFVKNYLGKERELNIGCAISYSKQHSENEELSTKLRQYSDVALDFLSKHNCNIQHIPNIVIHNNDELKKYIDGLDGLLISAMDVDLAECNELYKLNIPIVIFQAEHEHDLPFSQVVPDHFIAMRKLFELARPEMYSKLIVVYQDYSNLIARRDAFVKCALNAGFSEEQIDFCEAVEGESYSIGMKIADIPGSKLIFSTSAMLTMPVYNALCNNKLIPGQDFELIGYDDLENIEAHSGSTSQITAIDYSRKMASLTAAELLIEEIRKKRNFKMVVKLPTELIIRESALSFVK